MLQFGLSSMQLVAIPGWLREEQNAKLHQEEHFASIKEPRSPTTNYLLRGRGNKMVTQAISPPTPEATFGPRASSFQKSLRILKSASVFWVNFQF
jgi:hypothetical protein